MFESINDNIQYEFSPSFCDEILASLSNPKKGIRYFADPKISQQEANKEFGRHDSWFKDTNKNAIMASRKARRELVDAQKFYIDNKLLSIANELSYLELRKLKELAKRAIPPFDNMWIEWDEPYRLSITDKNNLEATESNNAEGSWSKVGYHITKINGNFFYTLYGNFNDEKKILIPQMGFFFSNDKPYNGKTYLQELKELYGHHIDHIYSKKNDLDTQRFIATYALLGTEYSDKNIKDDKEPLGKQLDIKLNNKDKDLVIGLDLNANWFFKRIMPCVSSGYTMQITDKSFHSGSQIAVDQDTNNSLGLQKGYLKLLIAIISTLNYDHIVYNNTKTSPKVSHLRNGMQVPKSIYKLVTIDLPKPKVRKIYKGILTGSGTPKSEHMRRGHWRRKPDGKKIWIQPMKVGNKKHGIIEHDYILRGSEGKSVEGVDNGI